MTAGMAAPRVERVRHEPAHTLGDVGRAMQNPLAAIVASSQVLLEELGPYHPCTGLARLIREAGCRLHRTVHDLAALSSPASFRPRDTDLAAILRTEVASARERARNHPVRIVALLPGHPVTIHADPELLASAAARLLDHQLSATPPQGFVKVVMERTPRDRISVRFSDDGPPVPREALPHLFEPFYAWGDRDCGLDLAFARRIIGLHGGSLRARRNRRGGLTFMWLLPAAPGETH